MTNQIGVIGLAVMGKNLALNIESRGYNVAVFNRTAAKTEDFMANEAKGKNFEDKYDMESLVQSLEKPRKIILMVQAGAPTDKTIESLLPHLDKGDILVDGGNTLYTDTIRRNEYLDEKGIHFIGAGVSGGEEGALKGPSIMPGGQKEAYDLMKPVLDAIAAKVDGDSCSTYIGPSGAGHYVKMVHNGIEYGDMQLIAEAYFILKHALGLTSDELHDVFKEWNTGELDSYLIEITADIFTKTDEETNQPMVDVILDKAGQKGTGKWTSINALELGVPLPLITESVFARCISFLKEERTKASKVLSGPDQPKVAEKKAEWIETVRKALYMSKICSYAQGFAQMQAQSKEEGWDIDLGNVAMIWRGGCIIRARFLQKIKDAYDRDENLANLLLDDYFKQIANEYQNALRDVAKLAIDHGIAIPAFQSAISYFDSYRSEKLSANLIQAQRDYFGAHTYERTDKIGVFHTNWL
ncbi:MAG TPA: NADP-dependent phosphogluconate dehydrogenase [Virgibacillus sp.]|nr:NADP-dependent phosphogluconate dehydrogenase [Virgibacillus sp.]HLR66674.1 NADP-dependent phosphogluconate dehydrogenase [Virgibacillus sp.]